MRIADIDNICARVRFLQGQRFVSPPQNASVEVIFEQKDTHYGLGKEHPLDGFQIRAQLANPPIGSNSQSFGWTMAYHDKFSMELPDLEQMYRFIKDLDRNMTAMDRRFGRCATFGQFVVRVLDVLGVGLALVQNSNDIHDTIQYFAPDLGQLTYPIDHRIANKNEEWDEARNWFAERS